MTKLIAEDYKEVILTFLKSRRSDVCHTRTDIYFSLEVEELEDMGDG